MTSKLVVNTIEADTGISSVSFASSISMSSTSKFHFSAAGIDIDADTNINRPAAGVLGFNINSSEKMRLDSSGRLLIGTTTEGNESADELTINSSGNTGITVRSGTSSNGSLFFTDATSGAAEYVGFVQYQHASNIMIFGTSSTERLRITSDGSIGINATTPSAGDLATGDSQNTPVLHVNGSGASDTTGEYNLIARFQSGTDADNTGAMIVLNHSNDRGLAIQGGRRTGNYAHGALKMIDNVGRVSDAMLIHGGAGQGVDHINFYTGISTITTNRLHIDNAGRVLINTTNNSNGHIAASNLAVQGADLAIFKDSEGDNAGVNSHKLKFVTQSGSIAEIMATSAGGGGPAGRGGYLSLFAKPNNNSTLKEMLRVSDSYVTILRENTSLEGGQLALARASDNAGYWMLDTYGSSSTPDFRIHAGGTSHFSINSSGQWVDAPTGTVIKVGYARYDPNTDNYVSIASNTKERSGAYLDYTCQRTDSKLIIMTRMHTRIIAAHGCSYGIDYSTNSGSSWTAMDGMTQRNAMDFFYKNDGVNHHYTGFCMRQIDAYSGTRRFSPWGQGWSGGTWEVSYGHGEHSVTIYEVAT